MLPSTVVRVLLAAGAGQCYVSRKRNTVDGWLDTVGALRDGGCNDVIYVVLGAVEVSAPASVSNYRARTQGLSAWCVRVWPRPTAASTPTTFRPCDRHADVPYQGGGSSP